jgi:hypothetical protein
MFLHTQVDYYEREIISVVNLPLAQSSTAYQRLEVNHSCGRPLVVSSSFAAKHTKIWPVTRRVHSQ